VSKISKPPEFYAFIVDECLGSRVATELASQWPNHTVDSVVNRFGRGTSDEVWLKAAGEQGLVVLTKDAYMFRRPNEIGAIVTHKVFFFALGSGNMSSAEMVRVFVAAEAEMLRLLGSEERPFAATISRSGTVTPKVNAAGVIRKPRKLRWHSGSKVGGP